MTTQTTDPLKRRSGGWTSVALLPIVMLMLLLGLIALGVVSGSGSVPLVSGVLVAVAVLFFFGGYRLSRIRKGAEVQVTRWGRNRTRTGTVLRSLPNSNLLEVQLHEVKDESTALPSETVELYWFDLKKKKSKA